MANEFDKISTLDDMDVEEFVKREVEAWTKTHSVEDLKEIVVSETRIGKGIKSSRNNGIIHIEVPSNKVVETQEVVRRIKEEEAVRKKDDISKKSAEKSLDEMYYENMLLFERKEKENFSNTNKSRRPNYSRRKKETLFSRFKKFIKKNWMILALGAGATVAIGQGITGEEKERVNNSQSTTKIIQETTKNPRDEFVTTLKTGEVIEIPSIVNCKSIEEVKEHFKKTYIEKYNEKYGTDYTKNEADMYVNSLENGVIYKVGDKQFTMGSKPEETKQILEQFGAVEKIEMNGNTDKVVQILVGGKILGTYNLDTGDYIYSGNDKELREKMLNEKYIAPTLEKLDIGIEQTKAAGEAVLAKDTVSGEEKEKDYSELYNKAVNTPKNNTNKEIEIVD